MSATKLLSNITTHLKYSKITPLGRKESWSEIVLRNKSMHSIKYGHLLTVPEFSKRFNKAYEMVLDKKVLPSMRSIQFAGEAIMRNNVRMYNCCYLPINDTKAFREVLYLLLCGTGVGYSVQSHHIEQLPSLVIPQYDREFVIQDSIEGWALALDALINAFTAPGMPLPLFNYDKIRPKGSLISSIGCAAPGPEPLAHSLREIERVLRSCPGAHLRSIDVLDIINISSESVLAGGIRRSAMICLFSAEDETMLSAKHGEWWVKTPWRSRSNNSAVIYRGEEEEYTQFRNLWKRLQESKCGEPGVYFSNDSTREYGTNPCVETALLPYQFCNLTEINASNVKSQKDFNDRCRAASFLGTLQAGYTDFRFLRRKWQYVTKKDALLGIGLTGIVNGDLDSLNLREGAHNAVEENNYTASLLGINSAARVTCVKPSGTSSLVLGCASGIHAVHSKYYIRHIRLNKDEPLYSFLASKLPDLVEDEYGREGVSAVLKIPQYVESKSYRDEPTYTFLERIKRYNMDWVREGHIRGTNKHNVSATISIKEDEWDIVGEWLWHNRDNYTGVACLPYDGGNYKQAPFESCDKNTYFRLLNSLKELDLDQVTQYGSLPRANDVEIACAGGACELK